MVEEILHWIFKKSHFTLTKHTIPSHCTIQFIWNIQKQSAGRKDWWNLFLLFFVRGEGGAVILCSILQLRFQQTRERITLFIHIEIPLFVANYLCNRISNWKTKYHQNTDKPYTISTHCKSISCTYGLWNNLTQQDKKGINHFYN